MYNSQQPATHGKLTTGMRLYSCLRWDMDVPHTSPRTVSPAAVQCTQLHSSLVKLLLTCCDTECTTTFSLAFNSPTGLGCSLAPCLKDHTQRDVCGRRDSPRQHNKRMKHTEHVFSQSSSHDSPQIATKEGDDKGITGDSYKVRGMMTMTATAMKMTTMTTMTLMMMAMPITPMTTPMMMMTPIMTMTATMMMSMTAIVMKMMTMTATKTTMTVTKTTMMATATKTMTTTTTVTATKMKTTTTTAMKMKTTMMTATKMKTTMTVAMATKTTPMTATVRAGRCRWQQLLQGGKEVVQRRDEHGDI